MIRLKQWINLNSFYQLNINVPINLIDENTFSLEMMLSYVSKMLLMHLYLIKTIHTVIKKGYSIRTWKLILCSFPLFTDVPFFSENERMTKDSSIFHKYIVGKFVNRFGCWYEKIISFIKKKFSFLILDASQWV